ncbi:response regulator [Sulfitobacter albidus]|uniref:Response regulator n=1 Tax=Sulfitobacter albidus TaxID=2829501 RepID=A0A975PND3_9RHOB|nr:response regulator [Sulfitobacter albidus]QUJ77733.1 response regulator [Sulfitobacter albidus]
MRILAVDDDPTILEITELFLESIGYRDVRLAPSAQHARRALDAEQTPFDCVLLDINMPEVTGIELIPDIIDHPVHHSARIVMLSALSDTQHIADAFVAGAIDYMLKPFELFDLEASIRAVEAQSLSERPLPVTSLDYDHSQMLQISRLIERGATLRSDRSGIVSPFAIENCIRRVPTSSRARAAVTLIEMGPLADGTTLHGVGFDTPYVAALSQAFVSHSQAFATMLSYNGDGVFTALSFDVSPEDQAAIEAGFRAAVGAADAAHFGSGSGQSAVTIRSVMCRDLPVGSNPLDLLRGAHAGEAAG